MIDGRDVIGETFEAGPAHSPEELLGHDRLLRARDEPHEVELAEAQCSVGCCGALNVTIRRDGDVVIWERWRDANGPDPADLHPFRFDATAYAAEIERATEDRSWEWPARTVARLLSERLRAEPGALAAWQCEFHAAASWTWLRDQLIVTFWHPGPPSRDRPFLQFKKVYPTTQQDPEVQAVKLFEDLTGTDPRERADTVGGSAEHARALGYAWPPTC